MPEEVNYIYEGGDYGFPKYFGIPAPNSGTEPPLVTLPDHAAPMGIVIYNGDKLPAKYIGRLIVSMWLRNEVVSIPDPYKLMRSTTSVSCVPLSAGCKGHRLSSIRRMVACIFRVFRATPFITSAIRKAMPIEAGDTACVPCSSRYAYLIN